jgi:hypothetical protein
MSWYSSTVWPDGDVNRRAPSIVLRDDIVLEAEVLQSLLVVVEIFRIHRAKRHADHPGAIGFSEGEGVRVPLIPAFHVGGLALARGQL